MMVKKLLVGVFFFIFPIFWDVLVDYIMFFGVEATNQSSIINLALEISNRGSVKFPAKLIHAPRQCGPAVLSFQRALCFVAALLGRCHLVGSIVETGWW